MPTSTRHSKRQVPQLREDEIIEGDELLSEMMGPLELETTLDHARR